MSYFPPSNQLYLANDANTALSGPIIPGSSGQVSNSQCTLSGAGSSYSTSGSNASLTVAIAFTHTPPENIYLLDSETDGTNSGWIQEGTWGATLGLPTPVSLSPSSGSGRSRIFTAVYSDPNGGRDLANLHLLFNTRLSLFNGCSVLYSRVTNAFYLSNDLGDVLSSQVTPGSTAQVSNSQCTLSGTGSSYSVSGNDITLQVALAFNSNIPQQKWTASDAQQYDYFGSAVSLSSDGNTALVGSGRNDFTGAAYVFTHSAAGWTQQKELTIPNAVAGDFFGYAAVLAGDGNTALVGAAGNSQTTGAAYVFSRSGATWTQQQQLTAPQPTVSDQFGSALALSGDGNTALVGTAGAANANGTAYIFTRSGSTFTQQQQLIPSDATSTNFGFSVALSTDGNTALVGAGYNNVSYVFTRSGSTWTQQARLTAPDAPANSFLGAAVALSPGGNNALVGAPDANGVGAAYLFTRSGSTWVQQRKFTASDATANSYFGSAVALANSGSTAFIGTAGGNAAYLFTRSGTTWIQQNELIASDANGQCCHVFGDAVALSGNGTTALVGDENGSAIGSAYWFNLAAGFIPLPAQKIYLSTTENNGSSSGWIQEGTWTPTQ